MKPIINKNFPQSNGLVILSILAFLSSLFTGQHLQAGSSFSDSFIIINGGPQAGDYYYKMAGGSANTAFSSINENVNLLSSPTLTLGASPISAKISSTGTEGCHF